MSVQRERDRERRKKDIDEPIDLFVCLFRERDTKRGRYRIPPWISTDLVFSLVLVLFQSILPIVNGAISDTTCYGLKCGRRYIDIDLSSTFSMEILLCCMCV